MQSIQNSRFSVLLLENTGGVMKQAIIIPVLVIFGLFSFSCNKNANTKPSSSYNGEFEIEPSFESNAPPAISFAGSNGYILRVNASLMVFDTDTGAETDKVKWGASMTLGERVIAGNNRRATYDGRVYDFVELRREDGKEGLAFATQIAVGATLAVVVDDKANLYNNANIVNVTGYIIPRKTIVAMLPGTETSEFVEIRAYDPVSQVNRQNFVRLSSLSRKTADVQSSILLQTAQPLKNEGADKIRKDALLDSALLYYSDSVFYSDIMELVNPNATATIKTESTSRSLMFANTDNVEVRDLPDLVAGKLIGRLADGEDVDVSERTTSTSTVNGKTDRWYHITEPFEGWVFGSYLD
jgi:hypothetical protein